ncbi:MAG: winged helix-turn-helix transcriptional regulator [Firmicutes bacterium]|nr:winged helix-turn-helix transcriptional regulator [Lachnospiraceae bacterium]MBQ7057683.1 winged helix-turn-helix transcriptional regulator [Bacillota bacterium]
MDLSAMLKALGEPTRLIIFQQLLSRKHCVRSLSKKLGITESAISQHMKVLKEAGLVYGERFGYHIHYLPKQEALDELCAAFSGMKQQSVDLCRDPQICQCEFREEAKK